MYGEILEENCDYRNIQVLEDVEQYMTGSIYCVGYVLRSLHTHTLYKSVFHNVYCDEYNLNIC